MRGAPRWWWAALAAGAALRLYFVCFTPGSFDVLVKLHHGNRIAELGLLEYYRQAQVMNHPPLMGHFFAALVALAEASGLPFRVLLRAPTALLDFGAVLLLLAAFRGHSRRWLYAAAHWLNPLAALYSAYHGNTDTAVGVAALAAVVLVSRGRAVAAGAALGAGLSIKAPVLLALPVLLLGIPAWRQRGRAAAALAGVAALGFLPALADPLLVAGRVFGYPGSGVETARGIAIWGIAQALSFDGTAAARALAAANPLVVGLPILLLAWLRRGRAGAAELGAGVCASFLLVYGVSSTWAWQYLAWSLPFWIFLGPGFAAGATLLIGAYVFGAYAVFSGGPWLDGRWDTVHHGAWPGLLDWLRDASVLLCLLAGGWQLWRSAAEARAGVRA